MEISTKTILKILGLLILLAFLWYIRKILVMLFVVLLIVAALSPIVDWFSQRKIPRFLAIFLIYFLLFSLFAFLIYLIIPPLVIQITELTHNFPFYLSKIAPTYEQYKDIFPQIQKGLSSISQTLFRLTESFWTAILTLFGGFISFLTILVLSIYTLFEEKKITASLISLLPPTSKEKILKVGKEIGKKIGGWLRAQFVLCLLIGIISGLVLKVLGIPYALTLGAWAGITEIVPTIGPIFGAVPAILIALTKSPLLALIVGLIYIGIQQLESQILVPNIMRKAVGLSPVTIIIALLIGGKLMGISGAVLAIPAAAGLSILIKEWRAKS